MKKVREIVCPFQYISLVYLGLRFSGTCELSLYVHVIFGYFGYSSAAGDDVAVSRQWSEWTVVTCESDVCGH